MKGSRRTIASKNRAVNLAAASASLLSLSVVPAIVHADAVSAPTASGVYVTILSPNPGTDLTGKKQVEISAYYESSYGVSSLDLFIDGKRLASKNLASAESRGEISFLVDADAFTPGAHAIVIRATATDQEVASARTTLTMPSVTTAVVTQSVSGGAPTDTQAAPTPAPQVDESGAPTIEIESPSKSETVQGLVQIKVNAVDASGKAPYVSLFVDKSFKTLRNFAPYTFDWDTTKLPNGPHLIEVYGYNDAQKVGHAKPIEVMVNNPSGRTFERHDLSDTVSSAAEPIAKPSAKPTAKAKVAKAERKLSAERPNLSFDFVDAIVPHLISNGKHHSRVDLNEMSLGQPTLPSVMDDAAIERDVADIVAVNKAAAHATKASVTRAGAVVRRTSAKNVPHLRTAPVILSDQGTVSGVNSLRSSDQLDNLTAEPLGSTLSAEQLSTDGAAAPKVVVTRRASTHTVPSLVQKKAEAKIVSAKTEAMPEVATGSDRIVAPKVDLNVIERNAQVMPSPIAGKRVSFRELSIRDMHALRGAREVVVDNRRISLNEPLHERGALLYAPMRQIFETQGGHVAWDQSKREVHAMTPVGEVTLKIGSHQAVINDKAVRMQGSAYLLNDRTMLPVDFYATALNAKVSFDPINGHLVIESND